LAAASLGLGLLLYLGSGFWAAVSQDGLSQEMHTGLGSEPPLAVRFFLAVPELSQRYVPIAMLLALALVGLRRLVRRAAALGESWLFDLALVPLGTGLVVGVVVGLLVWIGSPRPIGVALKGLVSFGLATAAVVALLDLLAASLVRSRVFRAVVPAFVVLLLVARVGADAWGSWRLAAYDREWEREVADERVRAAAAKRPVLRGEPRPENAAPKYRAALAAVATRLGPSARAETQSLDEAARTAPGSAVAEAVKAVLEKHRDTSAAIRDALLAERCDWETRYGELYWRAGSSIGPPRFVGALLVVEGHELAARRDLDGATGRYQDAAQFGSDYGSSSLLVGALVGSSIEATAFRALGRLVTGPAAGQPSLARIDRDLGRLEGALSSISSGYRNERLSMGHFQRRLDEAPAEAGLQEPLILPWLVPYRALAAHALTRYEPRLRELEHALAEEDPSLAARAQDRIQAEFAGTLNPILRGMAGVGSSSGNTRRARAIEDEARALLRLTRLATRVEQARDTAGRYPADLLGVETPADPIGWPAPLRYAPTPDRRGYKLWSVGLNGKDDGGSEEERADIVLERKAS